MTTEQIQTWHQQARDNLFARKSIISPQDILTEFARFVRDSALEEAKAACKRVHESRCEAGYRIGFNAIMQCADAIDALKEPQP